MKEKILYLVLGTLIGAMLTTGVFMIINKNNNQGPQFNGERREFDVNNLPEGFDVNNLPEGGPGSGRGYRINSNSIDSI